MTEVSASLVLRFEVKSPRQSCISKGFISYWLLIDTKILIRQAGEWATGNDSPTVGLIRKSVVGEHC